MKTVAPWRKILKQRLLRHTLVAAQGDQLCLRGFEVVLPFVPMFHVLSWGTPFALMMSGILACCGLITLDNLIESPEKKRHGDTTGHHLDPLGLESSPQFSGVRCVFTSRFMDPASMVKMMIDWKVRNKTQLDQLGSRNQDEKYWEIIGNQDGMVMEISVAATGNLFRLSLCASHLYNTVEFFDLIGARLLPDFSASKAWFMWLRWICPRGCPPCGRVCEATFSNSAHPPHSWHILT